jgi:uncharacterized Fe-S center protein
MIDITPFCDCAEFAPEYIKFRGDPTVQVREAHRMGLGEWEYELVNVSL